jgi:hypothetical protein
MAEKLTHKEVSAVGLNTVSNSCWVLAAIPLALHVQHRLLTVRATLRLFTAT